MVLHRVTASPQGKTTLHFFTSGIPRLPGSSSKLGGHTRIPARGVPLTGLRTARSSSIARRSVDPLTTPRQLRDRPWVEEFGVKGAKAAHMSTAGMERDIETYGKAASGTGQPSSVRGDCPFSQRTYLELEEKGIKYKSTYIQEGPNETKPKWFIEHNPSGLMPVLRDGDNWIQDSDKIAAYLEEKFPEPSLRIPKEYEQVGANLFPTFTKWLQSKDTNSPAKADYVKELRALNEHLTEKGPFIAGDRLTDADLKLAPRLRHAVVALAHFMNFRLSDEFAPIKEYLKRLEERESFKKTTYSDEMIIEGWKKKFSLPDKIAAAV